MYDNGVRHVYVALESEAEVAALRPDWGALAESDLVAALVGVNAFAGAGSRWKTRMFSPVDGVGEDAATGSAAGPLACHLARHGRSSLGRAARDLAGRRDRPAVDALRDRLGSDATIERVEVGGTAVVVARGEFRIP